MQFVVCVVGGLPELFILEGRWNWEWTGDNYVSRSLFLGYEIPLVLFPASLLLKNDRISRLLIPSLGSFSSSAVIKSEESRQAPKRFLKA